MQYLNQVKTTVIIDGNPCHFTTLHLEQRFDSHHSFDIGIMCPPLPNEGIWHHEREKEIAMMGKTVVIRMKHEATGDETIFRGLITGIKMESEEGVAGMLHYKGYSPTYLLESGKTMDSFTNYTLAEVVKEVVRNYGNGVEVVIAPKFYDRIPYLQMHKESGYEFLRRIAYQYGEWFYYDGMKLYFGNPYIDKEETVTYDVELRSVIYKSHIYPLNYSRYEYLSENNQEVIADSSRDIKGVNTYLYEAISASNSIYKSQTTQYNEAVNNCPIHLPHLKDMEKGRDIAGMSCIQGISNTCRVRIAQPLSVKIPASMCTRRDLGRYRIISVIHEIDNSGAYSNSFEGIPGNMEHIPVNDIKLPKAFSMLGTVVNNADPQGWGRIQVQFPWQKDQNKTTNWIRVGSPYIGKCEDGSKNRGVIFIPEVGDQVIVCFDGGNPGRPYVYGSLLPTNYPHKGEVDSQIKSISTPNGHTLELNDHLDGNYGITVKDADGSVVHIDSKNGGFQITAPESMNITTKNISMQANETIQIAAQENVDITAETDVNIAAKGNLTQESEGDLSAAANGDVNIKSGSDAKISGENVAMESKGEFDLTGKQVNISGKNIIAQGNSYKIDLK